MKTEDQELVPVFRTTDAGLLAVTKSVLDAAGIQYVVQGESGVTVFPLGPAAERVTGRVTGALILVRRRDAEEVTALLETDVSDKVRHETIGDTAAIREVNEQAFGCLEEADLIEALRDRGAITLSLVAVQDARVVGHALFTPAEIVAEPSRHAAIALGPMAVLPAYQRQGIGSKLVRYGLEALRNAEHVVVVVLGHPEYYPRFGFAPASRFGIRCQYDVADEAFMLLEFRRGPWREQGGIVQYQPEFGTG